MIEQIKARVSVRDVLEHLGVRIKNKTACCPIHPDKTPSLGFNEKGLWYCFVCGVGGDVVSLVQKTQGLSFKESLNWINDTFSLGLTYEKPKPNYKLDALNANYQILKDTLEMEFHQNCERWWALMDKSRGLNFPYLFWDRDDYTFEIVYHDLQDKIESQLKDLENARYKLRRDFTQTL